MPNEKKPGEKREQLRQQELKNNPIGSLSDGINRSVSPNLSDMKWKETLSLLAILMVVMGIASFINLVKKDVWEVNAELLKQEIISIEASTEEIDLSAVTPFEWDTVYSFAPYTPKEQIYEAIGYEWATISETVNDGMNQLVFLKEDEVVCYVYGYPENNGYGIYFSNQNKKRMVYASTLRIEDDVTFKVIRSNDVILLTNN